MTGATKGSTGSKGNGQVHAGKSRVREREVIRMAARLGGGDSAAGARAARQEVIGWAAKQVGDQLPAAALGGQSFEYLRGGRVCIGASFEDERRALWALRVDRPDANVAERIWTTEVVIGYQPGSGSALFSLRLLVGTPEEELRVEPAVPGLVRQVSTACGLTVSGIRLDGSPWQITSQSDAEELTIRLADPNRSIPYVVCSVAEGEVRPRIDVALLAKTTLGIARVVVVPPAHTWVLTQQFGKPLSVFNGAVRAYMPGFSDDANPYTHRLMLLDPPNAQSQNRAAVFSLRWLVANESVRRFQLGAEVVPFSVVRAAGFDIETARLQRSGSAATEQLKAAQLQINALKDDLRRSQESEQWLSDEHKAAEEKALTLEQQFRTSQYRIQQLLAQIKERGGEPDSGIETPTSWVGFADWCDEHLVGRITLSSRARRDLKGATFDDPSLAARCLLWLANEYRDSRINGSTGDLRKPLEEGIRNDRCGADSFEFGWNGKNVLVEWHIKNGGNTRDPVRCLRIYYFWDEEMQSVTIVSMPGHIRTGAT